MAGILDNAEVDIACSSCGRKGKQRLGRLKNNPPLRCAGCGTEIQINASGKGGLAQGLQSADKSLADLQRAFKKFGN